MNLDWKWVGIGVLIMLGLTLIAGIIAALILGSQLEGVTRPEDISLSNSQMLLISALNFLAFVIGGYIVGIKSSGKNYYRTCCSRCNFSDNWFGALWQFKYCIFAYGWIYSIFSRFIRWLVG